MQTWAQRTAPHVSQPTITPLAPSSSSSYNQTTLQLLDLLISSSSTSVKSKDAKIPRGIRNLYNNCFFNCVVQIILACPGMDCVCKSLVKFEKDLPCGAMLGKIYEELYCSMRKSWEQVTIEENIQRSLKELSVVDDQELIQAVCDDGNAQKFVEEQKIAFEAAKKSNNDDGGWSQVVTKKAKPKAEKQKSKRKQSRGGKSVEVEVLSTRRSNGALQKPSPSPSPASRSEEFLDAIFIEEIRRLLEIFFKSVGNQDGLGVQEDAQEFLHFLLETVHQEMVNVMNKSDIKIQDKKDDQDDGWSEIGTGNKKRVVREDINLKPTPISSIFGGVMQIILKKQGSKESVSYQPFFSLPLPLEEEHNHKLIFSLEEALESFKKISFIDGLRSETTSLAVKATKQCILSSIGSIVIFHLKRFSYANGQAYKLNHNVEYPLQFTLRVGKGVGEQNVDLNLRGIIVHHGNSPRKGHYSSFCKLSDESWYHFDDIRVTKVEESVILEQQAYLLLYDRV
jgi:ubiquitin C-terminal hydrolase